MSPQPDKPITIIVHHWLFQPRGGEQVLQNICESFPENTVITYFKSTAPSNWPTELAGICKNAKTTFVQPLFNLLHRFAPSLIPSLVLFMPFVMKASFKKTSSASTLIISDSGFAKCIGAQCKNSFAYIHTPQRHIWNNNDDISKKLPAPISFFWRLLSKALQKEDLKASRKITHWAANSATTKARMVSFYGIPEDKIRIIYPPCISISAPKPPPSLPREHYIVISGMEPYKRDDIAIEAANRLGLNLIILGEGRNKAKLTKIANPNVLFLGYVDEDKKRHLLESAKALLYCGEEDFGIVPVEAISLGCPVIAYGKGGALETVTPNISGLFFDSQTPEALMSAIKKAESIEWKPKDMLKSIQQFTEESFRNKFKKWVIKASKN